MSSANCAAVQTMKKFNETKQLTRARGPRICVHFYSDSDSTSLSCGERRERKLQSVCLLLTKWVVVVRSMRRSALSYQSCHRRCVVKREEYIFVFFVFFFFLFFHNSSHSLFLTPLFLFLSLSLFPLSPTDSTFHVLQYCPFRWH